MTGITVNIFGLGDFRRKFGDLRFNYVKRASRKNVQTVFKNIKRIVRTEAYDLGDLYHSIEITEKDYSRGRATITMGGDKTSRMKGKNAPFDYAAPVEVGYRRHFVKYSSLKEGSKTKEGAIPPGIMVGPNVGVHSRERAIAMSMPKIKLNLKREFERSFRK